MPNYGPIESGWALTGVGDFVTKLHLAVGWLYLNSYSSSAWHPSHRHRHQAPHLLTGQNYTGIGGGKICDPENDAEYTQLPEDCHHHCRLVWKTGIWSWEMGIR